MALDILKANIWSFWLDGYWIVIPTNGDINKYGQAIMGKGLALQATQRFPDLPQALGYMIKWQGNKVFPWFNKRLITFPVKYHWQAQADLWLIRKSMEQLVATLSMYKSRRSPYEIKPLLPVYIPKIGCGNGRLPWEQVCPIVEYYYEEGLVQVVEL